MDDSYGSFTYIVNKLESDKTGEFWTVEILDPRQNIEAIARHPSRALAFALRKLADSLIEESRREE